MNKTQDDEDEAKELTPEELKMVAGKTACIFLVSYTTCMSLYKAGEPVSCFPLQVFVQVFPLFRFLCQRFPEISSLSFRVFTADGVGSFSFPTFQVCWPPR